MILHLKKIGHIPLGRLVSFYIHGTVPGSVGAAVLLVAGGGGDGGAASEAVAVVSVVVQTSCFCVFLSSLFLFAFFVYNCPVNQKIGVVFFFRGEKSAWISIAIFLFYLSC